MTEPLCAQPGTWIVPATGQVIPHSDVMAEAAGHRIVLLGETHDRRDDHLWQAHSMAGIIAHNPEVQVGFEMFARRFQPELTEFSSGTMSTDRFLEDAGWKEHWGFGADLYRPLFDFVRLHRIPAFAMNVDRQLVSRVGKDGWHAIPVEEREGVDDPAPASESYRDRLLEVYNQHKSFGSDGDDKAAPSGPDDEGFLRFLEAQQTWDRAMAEALFFTSEAQPNATIIGILGRGHIEYGEGVPEQLRALGAASPLTLLTLTGQPDCASVAPDLADYVFVAGESL